MKTNNLLPFETYLSIKPLHKNFIIQGIHPSPTINVIVSTGRSRLFRYRGVNTGTKILLTPSGK